MANLKQITRDAITEAYLYDIESVKYDLKEHLNKGSKTILAWSYISKNIENKSDNNIYTKICERSSRHFLLIFDREINSLYVIINYRQYKKSKSVYSFPQYIQAFLFEYNQYDIQSNMFDLYDTEIKSKYSNILDELIGDFPNDILKNIESFNIITYHVENDILISLNNYILDYETLTVIQQENWMMETISNPLELTVTVASINDDKNDNGLSLTNLSEEKIKQKNNIDLTIKREKEDKSKNA